MTHAPRIPKEEASFADEETRATEDAATSGSRDLEHGSHKARSGDSAVNADEQGGFGELKQNLTNQWKVRESSAVPRDQVRR